MYHWFYWMNVIILIADKKHLCNLLTFKNDAHNMKHFLQFNMEPIIKIVFLINKLASKPLKKKKF